MQLTGRTGPVRRAQKRSTMEIARAAEAAAALAHCNGRAGRSYPQSMATHAAAPVEETQPERLPPGSGRETAQPGRTRCSAGAWARVKTQRSWAVIAAAGCYCRCFGRLPTAAATLVGEFRSKAGLDSRSHGDGEFRSIPRTRSGKDLRGSVGGRPQLTAAQLGGAPGPAEDRWYRRRRLLTAAQWQRTRKDGGAEGAPRRSLEQLRALGWRGHAAASVAGC